MTELSIEEKIPELDRDFLHEKEFDFEILPNSDSFHLIIKNFSFPEQYIPRQADLLIILPVGYPNSALDMFRTYPNVKLSNGNWPIAASTIEQYNGKDWQRWSRHNIWRVGKDNLRTFITSIKKELERGI